MREFIRLRDVLFQPEQWALFNLLFGVEMELSQLLCAPLVDLETFMSVMDLLSMTELPYTTKSDCIPESQ